MKLNRQIQISGNAPIEYPADIFFAILWQDDEDAISIPILHPYCGEWGEPLSIESFNYNNVASPQKIDMVWLSVREKKFYSLEADFPFDRTNSLLNLTDKKNGEYLYDCILVGLAPHGKVAIWAYGIKKSVIIECFEGKEANVDMQDFAPMNPKATIDTICNSYLTNCSKDKNEQEVWEENSKIFFDKIMNQYIYCYSVNFALWDNNGEKWNTSFEEASENVLDFIEEKLIDGTHDKLHDDNLLKYHKSGIPKRLSIQWHRNNSVYSAFFWFNVNCIITEFEKIHNYHPNIPLSFVLKIDTKGEVFHLFLECGDKNTQIKLKDNVFQLIVFKNQLEYYRSNNYNQPRGAWVW